MIIIVGSEYRLSAMAEVVTKRLNENVGYIPENISIKNQENDILALGEAKYIIYDIDQYFDETVEIINIIKRIQRVNKAKPILYVATDNPKSEIIKAAVAAQIKSFVNESLSLGMQKDQLEKIINGFYEVHGREDVRAAEDEVNNDNKTLNEFVGELYDAKQREDEKEHTIIINKKGRLEVVIDVVISILKFLFAALSVVLIAIAIITLIYKDTREALFYVLDNTLGEILSMIKL
ncbi:Uncharacterised protein [[Eubacterium] infirmum]|nr:Uncharacterised protein [[Eubacterium] infirmum]